MMLTKTKEIFDVCKASILINNKLLFRGKIRDELFTNDSPDPFMMLEKYVNMSKKGVVKTSYQQRNNRGRFFADGSVSLQSLAREIRGTIAGEFYYDIDMVNAHPVIFKKLCDDIELSTTYINDYCYNRDKIIEKLIKKNPDLNHERIKSGILSIINGGGAFYNAHSRSKWLTAFYDETKANIDALCNSNPNLYEEMKVNKDFNPQGATVNIMFCIEENKLLQIMIGYFKEKKVILKSNNYVNCFDGLMVEKARCKNINDHIMNIEKLFENEGFNMKLKQKTFQTIDLTFPEGYESPVASVPIVYKIKPNVVNKFDYADPYTFLDFYNKYTEYCFESEDEMDAEILDLFPRVISRILLGDGLYIKKTINGVDITKRLGLSDFTVYYMSIRDGFPCRNPVKLSNELKKYRSFDSISCALDNESVQERSFNIWKGFKSKRVNLDNLTNEVKEGFELLKTFLWEIWAMENEEYYKYILSWFAGLVANLNGINRVALAMISKEGTGKNTITDFMSLILDDDAIAECTGVQSVTQKHNTIIQNKRLVLINEMSSTKDEFKSNFDKIKPLITDKFIQIEPKGVAPYKINNIGNYILYTNHADSIIVSQSDRRYAIFEMSDKYRNNVEYFTNLRAKCFNQDVADAFYTYLLDFETVCLSHIPITGIRAQLQTLSLPTPLKFYNYIVEEEIYENGADISGFDLYRKFVAWCNDNGERVVSGTKFGTAIKEKWVKRKSHGTMKYTIVY